MRDSNAVQYSISIILWIFLIARSLPAQEKIPAEFERISSEDLIKKGMAFHRKKEYGKSAEFFKYAVLRDPDSAKAHFNLACALAMRGEAGPAMMALERAGRINPLQVLKWMGDTDLTALFKLKEFQLLRERLGREFPNLTGRRLCKGNGIEFAGGEYPDADFDLEIMKDGVVRGEGQFYYPSCARGEMEGARWETERGAFVLIVKERFEETCYGNDPSGGDDPDPESLISHSEHILRFASETAVKDYFAGCDE